VLTLKLMERYNIDEMVSIACVFLDTLQVLVFGTDSNLNDVFDGMDVSVIRKTEKNVEES